MKKEVLQYQKAYKALIEDLEKNDDVLAVTVFGSIITGDLWERSDIDMFIVMNNLSFNKKDFYGEKLGIQVHMRVLSKDDFINFKEIHIAGSETHRKLMSSKLVICKDREIVNKYNELKLLNNIEKEKWSLVYLAKIISSIGHCKKALENGKLYGAFYSAMKLGDSYSKLYLNLNNYMLNSDPLSMAINLDDKLKIKIDKIVKEHSKESIENFIEFVEDFLNKNILEATTLLIETLKAIEEPVDSSYIKSLKEFSGVNISMEKILKELSRRAIIKTKVVEYKTNDGNKLIEELVYYYEEGKG